MAARSDEDYRYARSLYEQDLTTHVIQGVSDVPTASIANDRDALYAWHIQAQEINGPRNSIENNDTDSVVAPSGNLMKPDKHTTQGNSRFFHSKERGEKKKKKNRRKENLSSRNISNQGKPIMQPSNEWESYMNDGIDKQSSNIMLGDLEEDTAPTGNPIPSDPINFNLSFYPRRSTPNHRARNNDVSHFMRSVSSDISSLEREDRMTNRGPNSRSAECLNGISNHCAAEHLTNPGPNSRSAERLNRGPNHDSDERLTNPGPNTCYRSDECLTNPGPNHRSAEHLTNPGPNNRSPKHLPSLAIPNQDYWSEHLSNPGQCTEQNDTIPGQLNSNYNGLNTENDEVLAQDLERNLNMELLKRDEELARRLEEEERNGIQNFPDSPWHMNDEEIVNSSEAFARPPQHRNEPNNRRTSTRARPRWPLLHVYRDRVVRHRTPALALPMFCHNHDVFDPDEFVMGAYRTPAHLQEALDSQIQHLVNLPGEFLRQSVDFNDYEALWDLAERIGEAKGKGLSDEALSKLDMQNYREGKDTGDNNNCVICMSEFCHGDKVTSLKCQHQFHHKCIKSWLKRKAVCPVCREPIGREDN